MSADQRPGRALSGGGDAVGDPALLDAADVGELTDRELMARHVRGDGGVAFGELLFDLFPDGPRLGGAAANVAFHASAVTTWLHRIVVNACLDRLRREKVAVRRAGDLGELDLPDPRDHHSAAEARLIVHAALAQLPEGQRLALVLVDMQGLSVAEAAVVLGVAEGTVKSRCFRGREALAELVGGPDGSRFKNLGSETEPQGAP